MLIVDIAFSRLMFPKRCATHLSKPRTGRNGQSVQPHADQVDDANEYGPEAQRKADEKTSDNLRFSKP